MYFVVYGLKITLERDELQLKKNVAIKKENCITQHVNVFCGPLVKLLCNEMSSLSRNSKRNLCNSKYKSEAFRQQPLLRAKPYTRFYVRVRVVYNLLKRFFRRYSHSTHRGMKRIAHQSFLKCLGGISRSVDSFHFVCEAFCNAKMYVHGRLWEVSYEERRDQNRLQSLAGSTFSVFSEDMLVIILRHKIKEIRVYRRFKTQLCYEYWSRTDQYSWS